MALFVALGIAGGTAHADGSWPSLSSRSSVAADGQKDAALVIAIEDYAHLPSIPGARLNGNDWYAFFTEQKQTAADHVHYLKDEQATRENILAEATKAAAEARAGGTLFVIFIGHGAPANDGSEGVLVTADTLQSEESLYARSVAQHELAQAMDKGRAAHRVLLVDADFSGHVAMDGPLTPGFHPLPLRPVPPPNLTLLDASDPEEFAGPLPGMARPAFSYLVLGALRGWATPDAHGAVTAREAVGYARKMLSELPIHRRQSPSISGADLDVPLASGGSERGPPPADFVPAPPAPPPRNPAPPPPPAVTNREILLPTDPAPSDAVFADFTGDAKDWTLINLADHERPVCSLPCSRWVPLAASLAYVKNEPAGESFLVRVSDLYPGARIKFHLDYVGTGLFLGTLLKGSLIAGGVVLAGGTCALLIKFGQNDEGDAAQLCAYAVLFGGAATWGGTQMSVRRRALELSRDVVAPPHTFDATRAVPRAHERGPRLMFTGNGFAGTF